MNILGCRLGAPVRLVMMSIAAFALTACGGGGGGGGGGGNTSTPPPATYSIGGSVTGLSGTLVLQDNGGNNLSVTAAGNFTFSTKLASGTAYSVTVLTQPSGQTCSVTSGSGTVSSSNVTNVAVACTASGTGAGVTIGGTVTGLTGTGLVLQDNGGDDLTITKNGAFTFATSLASGTAYAVTVSTQPTSPSQTCKVSSGTGTTASTNVTSVAVSCASVGMFAYTASNTGNEIYAFTISPTTGQLSPVSGSPYTEGTAPAAVSLAPNGKFAFSATNDGKEIYAFTIEQNSGALMTVPGSPFPTGFANGSPYPDIAVSPNSQDLYLASSGDGEVVGFSIDPTSGALTQLPHSPYTAGAGAAGIPAFSPNGDFLYVVNSTAGTVSGWSIGSDGSLTSVGADVSTGGADPVWIAFTPNGEFAYVSNNGGNSVAAFSVNTTTGVLTALGSPTPVSESPEDLTINSAGTYLYVPMGTGSSPGGIQVYAISPAGALAAVGSLNQVGIRPLFVDIDPSGQFAYTTSAGTGGTGVYGFAISSTTGELTALSGSPYTTGPAGSGTAAEPQFITIDPSGQFGYTADEGTGTITGFTINQTTGVLSQVPGSPYSLPGGKPFFVSISPEAPGIRD